MRSLENKISLLTEKISCTNFLITEMKRIGIEKLPYSQSSLKRFIDSKTMDVHYNKHYKGYVEKLNKALSKKNYGDVELENIVKSISRYNKTIRNNAGGAFNHALFWKMLSPKKQDIPNELKSKIIKDFGSINNFKQEFSEVAKDRFGSGWAWLVLTKNNRLKIMSTPNQDNPLMNIIDGGGFPILGLDVWEHAYYLKYQNKRDEYINNFWDVVNWEFVNKLLTDKTKTKLTESVKSKKIIQEQVDVLKSNGRLNPAFVQTMLKKVYPKCSPEIIKNYNPDTRIESPCYGKIESELCNTNYGVIGGKYAVSQRGGTGEWSVLNWFDANTRVSDMILDLYKKFNSENIDLKSWLNKMSKTLLGEDGKFTPKLADIILNPETQGGTLNRGIEREKIAVDIFNSKYKNLQINQFCDGDIRDKYNGQDMFVTKNGVSKYVQVKPTKDLYELKDENGNQNYLFKSKNRYDVNNIQIFCFIDNKDNYIFFDFDEVEIKDEGGESKERYSYIFKPEHIKFKSPNLLLNKGVVNEGKKTIIITNDQLNQVLKKQDKVSASKYETLLTGKVMAPYRTGVRIKFRCKKEEINYINQRSFRAYLDALRNKGENFEKFIENLIVCVINDLEEQEPEKSDLKVKKPLYDENKKKLFSPGDLLEVKMMDVETDSFLSELFAIFKSKKNFLVRNQYIELYDYVLDKLLIAFQTNGFAKAFLGKIRSKLKGIVFDNNILVPIKFIKIYWSDKGQRGCTERRLSIRFKVLKQSEEEKPEPLVMYKYDSNSQLLKTYDGEFNPSNFDEQYCKSEIFIK